MAASIRRAAAVAGAAAVAMCAAAAPSGAHTITPSSHDFGQVAAGKTAPHKDFTVTAFAVPFNATNSVVTGSGFERVNAGQINICGGSSGMTLTPGQTCVVSIVFRAFTPGLATGSVTVGNPPDTVTATLSATALSGTSGGSGRGKKKKKCKKHKGRAAAAKKCKKK